MDDAEPIKAIVIRFDEKTGYPHKLLEIADPDTLNVEAHGDHLVLTAFHANGKCHLCGSNFPLELEYDETAQALALSNPNPESIALYKELEGWVKIH